MKTIVSLLAVAILASACSQEWNPSAAEQALSAREDARDRAMADIMQYKTK